MKIIRAVPHIRLCAVNHTKIARLDALAEEYLRLCQQYTTCFCTEADPDGYLAPTFPSPLSQRWQRVAIQHAAGIAQSWRSNYANATQEYLDAVAAYEEEHAPDEAPPVWKDWNTPVLKEPVIQANANVALLQPSQESTFDYWLRLSTLEARRPVRLPVKLAPYHRKALAGKTVNTSVTLVRKSDGWWLTLSYDEQITIETPKDAPVIGIDVGIANLPRHLRWQALWHVQGEAGCTPQARSREAPSQGEIARLSQEEGREALALYCQPEAGTHRPAGNQPRRQPNVPRSP